MKKYVNLSNRGVALPAVLLVMVIVMTLATAGVRLATQQAKEETFYENDTSSLHAAEAGLNKYLWHLNKVSSTIDMDTVITYPQDNPVAAFKLASVAGGGANLQTVNSTGWMLNDPTVTQTVQATFQKRSFTQYIYFSDNDPSGIWWSTSDNCYGPYHTNSNLSVKGSPNFWGKATYVNDIAYYTSQYVDTPQFHAGNEKVAKIKLPTDNSELMFYGMAPEGYYFEGRTSILLNSNGTFTVWNPNYTPAIKTLPLPANGVIYVNDKGTKNYSERYNVGNGNVFISGVLDGKLTVAAKHDIFITGYDPTKSSLSSAAVTNGVVYKDTTFTLDTGAGGAIANGDASQGDMLGLIADNNISVLTQGWFTGGSGVDSSRKDFEIHAAMMAIHGQFINSCFIGGSPSVAYPQSPGTLTVRGSIVQLTRGAVGYFNSSTGLSSSGYSKNYAHDIRMMYDQPPHFLMPDDVGWEVLDWK